jgi:hypothetical protein
MADFDPHIEKNPVKRVSDPDYSLNYLQIDSFKEEVLTPFKTTCGNRLSFKDFTEYGGKLDNMVIENERYVKGQSEYDKLKTWLDSAGRTEREKKLNTFFGVDTELFRKGNTVLSLSFNRNLYKLLTFESPENKLTRASSPFTEDTLIPLLSYIHAKSSFFVLVPDMKMGADPTQVQEYVDHIDFCVDIFSKWNKKPIFVPINMEFSPGNIREILQHYAKMRYTNIWINFFGIECSPSLLSDLKTTRIYIEKEFKGKDVVLYYSHMRKELAANDFDSKAAASDILTQFCGADFVGIDMNKNRQLFYRPPDPGKIQKKADEKQISIEELAELTRLCNRRIFDPKSYYYLNLNTYPVELPVKYEALLDRAEINNFANSLILSDEIKYTKEYAIESTAKSVRKETLQLKTEEQRQLRRYIESKPAINDNRNLLEKIYNSGFQFKIDHFDGVGTDVFRKLGGLGSR